MTRVGGKEGGTSERRLKQRSCTSRCLICGSSLTADRRADERGGFRMEAGEKEGAAGRGGRGSAQCARGEK